MTITHSTNDVLGHTVQSYVQDDKVVVDLQWENLQGEGLLRLTEEQALELIDLIEAALDDLPEEEGSEEGVSQDWSDWLTPKRSVSVTPPSPPHLLYAW